MISSVRANKIVSYAYHSLASQEFWNLYVDMADTLLSPIPSVPHDNAESFSPALLPTKPLPFRLPSWLFQWHSAMAFCSPSWFFIPFLLTRSLVTCASPSSLSWLLVHLTNLNTSLNVGPSVSIINQHFQLVFSWALLWTLCLLYNTLFLNAT